VARAWLFCGNPANSLEHAFPRWLNKLLPATDLTHRRHEAETLETKSAWRSDGFDFKVRHVCGSCNSGWMNDVEVQTQDLLIPLVLGQRTYGLTHPEQKRLSVWAYKTAIVLALITPPADRFVPVEHYKLLRDTRMPPHDTWIWIAGVATESRGEVRSAWSQPEKLVYTASDGTVDPRHGYRLSFSVMSLMFQVIWEAHGAKLERPRGLSDVFTRIRPISKGHWPPGRLLTLDALDDLHNGRFLEPAG
jgi:hypothetical protein